MDDKDVGFNLDAEFKRYLQILRPYLGQLVDQEVVEICNAWIKRLSNCTENEHVLRNKYVFTLCYQLARGYIDMPFLKIPPKGKLEGFSIAQTEASVSTDAEYVALDPRERTTQVLYNNNKPTVSESEYLSQDVSTNDDLRDTSKLNPETRTVTPHKHFFNEGKKIDCFMCPEINESNCNSDGEEYEYRANNVIMRLREIKKQNVLLRLELEKLKDEPIPKPYEYECDDDNYVKIDNGTNVCLHNIESSTTVRNLKYKLQDLQHSRRELIKTIEKLQDTLDTFQSIKDNEIEDLKAKHKLELINVRSATRQEVKEEYDNKIAELKKQHDSVIEDIQHNITKEINDLTLLRDQALAEKNKCIQDKDAEIMRLKTYVEEQQERVQTLLGKVYEKSEDESGAENMRIKAEQLEKRLSKMEKIKMKCVKAYEAKLSQLQREKHLGDCSVQLQLMRQRAQIINEVVDDKQTELATALDKLETKYKEIVANIQATAIQRRLQDQMTLETLMQAVCGIPQENPMNCTQATNQTQYKTTHQSRNDSFDSEVSCLTHGNKTVLVGKTGYSEEADPNDVCLDAERMEQLFERVYTPQRDIGDVLSKKQ